VVFNSQGRSAAPRDAPAPLSRRGLLFKICTFFLAFCAYALPHDFRLRRKRPAGAGIFRSLLNFYAATAARNCRRVSRAFYVPGTIEAAATIRKNPFLGTDAGAFPATVCKMWDFYEWVKVPPARLAR